MNKEVRQKQIISHGLIESFVYGIRRILPRVSLLHSVLTVLCLWWVLTICSSWYSWKAVFLDNEQVFFGKFINIPFTSKIVLRHAHYVKVDSVASTSQNRAIDTNQDAIIAPIKEMVHGPKGKRIIHKDHILYYEVLQTNTSLVKGLNESISR